MGFTLTQRSRKKLASVHPHLVRVVERAAEISPHRFRVLEGVRSIEKQRENVRKGVSWTMNSRHLRGENGYAHAVDLIPLDENGRITWAWPYYHQLAPFIKEAAKDVGVPVEWGGDWRNTKDGPHWQLPRSKYPAAKAIDARTAEEAEEVEKAPPHEDETESQALVKSRTVWGTLTSVAGGGGVAGSQGSLMGYIVLAVIVAAGLYIIYARWDDAGRPSPREIIRGMG